MTHSSSETETYATKLIRGLSLVGSMFGPNPQAAGTALVQVCTETFKEDVLVVAAQQALGRMPTCPADLEDPKTVMLYNRMLANARSIVERIIVEAEQQDKAEKREALAKLQAELRQSNKPDPMGTVAELATKFNKSKSEIRRLKAEGLLHTLTEENKA